MDITNAAEVRRLAREYKLIDSIQDVLTTSDNWVILHPKIVKALSNDATVQSRADTWITGRKSDIEADLTALNVDITNIGNL